MNDSREDRLYELLPSVYRMRDAEQGEPLRALLQVIAEQVNLVEDDIQQLYENWFIETCEDWAVPYIGDLVGYESVHEAGEPSGVNTAQGRQRNKILIPRREVANTIRYRRRKGTLALLELLADDVAGWPARVVEFRKLLARTQAINHHRLDQGQSVDIRRAAALELLDSPFDEAAHTVDVRRVNSHCSQGRHNIPGVGIFVWRLKSYSITEAPAYCLETPGPNCFTFSVLGNDTPLYMYPESETDPTCIADEFNLPVPIQRRLLEDEFTRLYGQGKSLRIFIKRKQGGNSDEVPPDMIIPADLSDWQYAPPRNKIAVDPVLGRIAFPIRQLPRNGVLVSYRYGFSMDLGGGEYERTLQQPDEAVVYHVGNGSKNKTICEALKQWRSECAVHAVIEIMDSNVYDEQINVEFRQEHKSLELRAGNGCRPVIRLLDWKVGQPDSLTVTGTAGSRFTLDGILITGRSMQVSGDLAELTIRHSTLVPGWTLDSNTDLQRFVEPSLEILSPEVCVRIEHSILGTIQVNPAPPEPDFWDEEVKERNGTAEEAVQAECRGIHPDIPLDPIRICIEDSILDATDSELEAVGAPGCSVAHTVVTFVRSTVIGEIQVHAVQLGENSIFWGRITVARRQIGCLRFCYVEPESRTPKRYRCQPDLVKAAISESCPEETEKDEQEIKRVRPQFNSLHYGTPTYCQLADDCAEEIKQGADDESEMGVFHDLYQPQRMASLRVRLDEYLPARMDVGVIVSD